MGPTLLYNKKTFCIKCQKPYLGNLQDIRTISIIILSRFQRSTMSGKSTFNGWLTALGILFLIVLLLFAGWIFYSRPGVTKVEISLIVPTDSIDVAKSEGNIETLKTLSATIEKQEEELHRYYELFLKARQDDADMLKIISILGAIIIAFGTFLGVRNLKDFKDKVSTDAKQTAIDTVTRITNRTLKSTVSSEISKSFDNDVVFRDIKSRIQEEIFTTFIAQLQEDVAELKKKKEPASEPVRNENSVENQPETQEEEDVEELEIPEDTENE